MKILAVIVSAYAVTALVKGTAERKRFDELVAACERGNVIREQVNAQGDVLREFLASAARARTSAARLGEGEQARVDAHTAARYRNLRTEIDPIEIPDCADAFDRP